MDFGWICGGFGWILKGSGWFWMDFGWIVAPHRLKDARGRPISPVIYISPAYRPGLRLLSPPGI